jgi:WD40 repeat protein
MADIQITSKQTHEGHSDIVWSVACSPDSEWLASASSYTTIKLWNLATAKRLLTLLGHKKIVASVTWSLDSTQLASCSEDNTIKIAKTGQCISTFNSNSNSQHMVLCVA